MKRRDFIFNTGVISAAVCLPFTYLFGKNKFLTRDSKIWINLVEYARWCPSPHNVQPWKIKLISEREAHLYYDPLRVPSVVDDSSSFTITGMGMFIECMDIAARAAGYKIVADHASEEHLDSSAREPKLFAKLYLIETNEKPDTDLELIKKRKTSRLHYDDRIISPDIVNALVAVSAKYGYDFTYSSNKELINYTIVLNNETILIRSDDKPAREEMCKWIRTTDKEAEEKKDGLWFRGTGVAGKMTHNFFYHHEHFARGWKRKKSLHLLNKTMTGTANIAWITGKFENRNDWIKAGTMLQRLWLEMTKYNVYMHPFGTVVTTPDAKEKFKKKINYDEAKGNLWFLVRLGYSEEPPRSFRLDLKDIII